MVRYMVTDMAAIGKEKDLYSCIVEKKIWIMVIFLLLLKFVTTQMAKFYKIINLHFSWLFLVLSQIHMTYLKLLFFCGIFLSLVPIVLLSNFLFDGPHFFLNQRFKKMTVIYLKNPHSPQENLHHFMTLLFT